MKHKDLLNAMVKDSGLALDQVQKMTDDLVLSMSDILSKGDSVSIQGFGSFEVKKKEERLSVHPQTKMRVMIPPKLVPVFRPGANLKAKFKERQYE